MIWFIDLDSTLNNLAETWAYHHNRKCMICTEHLDWRKIDKWNMHEFVNCGHNIYTYLNDPEIYLDCVPQPHAQEAMRYLLKRHSVYIVTDVYNELAIVAKYQWLRTYFPEISNVITLRDKYLLRGDVMIDDKPENLLLANTKYRVAYHQPWNSDIKDINKHGKFKNIVKMRHWNEIYDLEAAFLC